MSNQPLKNSVNLKEAILTHQVVELLLHGTKGCHRILFCCSFFLVILNLILSMVSFGYILSSLLKLSFGMHAKVLQLWDLFVHLSRYCKVINRRDFWLTCHSVILVSLARSRIVRNRVVIDGAVRQNIKAIVRRHIVHHVRLSTAMPTKCCITITILCKVAQLATRMVIIDHLRIVM